MRWLVLLFISFVDAIGIFITYPVMPRLLIAVGHIGLAHAVLFGGWMLASFAIAQLLMSPICGMLSDAFGRRPVLLLSLLAYALDYGCMSLANALPWLFIGRLVSGGVGATSVTVNAYVADITEPEQRAARYGLIGSAYGLGFVLGPAIGGLLAPLGLRAPFVAAAVLAAITGMLSFVGLPETLTAEMRKPIELRQMNIFPALIAALRRKELQPFFLAIFFFELSFSVYPSLWSYYLLQRFHWSALLIGLSLALTGTMVMLGQGLVLGILVKRIGERKTIIVGAASTIVAFLGYAFATQSWMIFVLSLLDLVSFMVIPALTALVSEHAKADEQGYIQGIVASLNGLSLVVGPLLSTQIFAWSTIRLHNILASGTAFVFAACLCCIALWIIVREKNLVIIP